MTFKKVNLNPTGKNVGDCVIRAIMRAEKNSWQKTFMELCRIGHDIYQMPNSKDVYRKYLNEKGWSKMPMPRFENRKRYTVRDFINEFNKGIYIIEVARHLTIDEDGVLIDSWDCGYKCVGNYFKK